MQSGPGRKAVPLLLLLLGWLLAFEFTLGLCIQEDAFISFRYARNLVDGAGLVYNPGERVEGYTNFLWTLLIAGGMALGIDPVPWARFLGMAASLALVLLTFRFARRQDLPRGVTGGILAASLVALSPAVAGEGVQGLETVFFALLVTAAVQTAVRARESVAAARAGSERRFLVAGALFALAALTRPEGVGVFGLATAAGFLWQRRRGMACYRAEVGAVFVFLLIYLPYWLWRFDYYGYPVPNTFYCKTGGGLAHLWRGLQYVGHFLLWNPVLPLLTLWAGWRARRRDLPVAPPDPGPGSPLVAVVTTVVVGYLAYVAVVGGDFKHTFRFVIPVLPLWAVLLDGRVSHHGWPRLFRSVRPVADRPPAAGRRVAGARLAWLVLALVAAGSVLSGLEIGRWSRRRAWDLTRRTAIGKYLAASAPADAVLAIHSAGIVPYYSGLYTIDMWGLNDLHIAHRKMPPPDGPVAIGHEKNDDAYVFSRRPTYYVDEWYYVVEDSIPDLRSRTVIDLEALGVFDLYRERHWPLLLDDGRGPRRYWFNYLERAE